MALKHWNGIINEYRSSFTNIPADANIITLNEGNTTLIRAYSIEAKLKEYGIINPSVYAKIEGVNPTGSFKDRGMTSAITCAIHDKKEIMVCASTGNTSASAAAYTAKARSMGYNAKCIVLIPDGHVALGKLAQAIAYGATIVQITGNFDQALNIVKKLSEQSDKIALVNSINPHRIEGQKTGAFELCNQLQQAPDILCIPVGNAGNITAYWTGFQEYYNQDIIKSKPQLFGFQAAGSAPLVHGHPIENPETIATAIRIGNPASWTQAETALSESNGLIDSVTDKAILQAYKLLHHDNGISCEPASAASIAGLLKTAQLTPEKFGENQTIACVLTGHGLKDPQTMIDIHNYQPIKTNSTLEAVASAIQL